MKRYLLLITLLSTTPGYGQMPGRLFFSPAERTSIDQSVPAASDGASYRLDGSLKTGHGQHTYWINGQAAAHPKPALAVGDSSDAPLLPANSLRIHRTKTHRGKQR